MTAGDNSQTTSVQITHVFFVFVLFYTPNLCTTTQHEENMRNLYWCSLALGSPATIALSVLRANEATCKLTAWDILIPVKVLLVIWCVLIN